MARPTLAAKKHELAPLSGAVRILSVEGLGQTIREKRVAAGLTIAGAAPLCNVGLRFLSEIERGKPGAELGKVLQVLQTLGLDIFAVPRKTAQEKL